MTLRSLGGIRHRIRSHQRVLLAVSLALLVSGSAIATALLQPALSKDGATGTASPSVATPHRPPPEVSGVSSATPTTPAASAATVGSVVQTNFLNYNSTLAGNFASTVAGWQVGTPAYVPTTHTLWLPEFPVSVGGIPAPPMAPAVRYNTISDQFSGFVPWLSNTSAMLFDPNNGFLYSADSSNATVGVIDATTGLWSHRAIPVGTDPVALALNPRENLLYVANAGSNNITVINCATNRVGVSGVFMGSGTAPHALAFDPYDRLLFVADGGDKVVRTVDTRTNLSGTLTFGPLPGIAGGVAYSHAGGSVAVTVPGSTTLLTLNASALFPVFIQTVGHGVGPVVSNPNGSEFVAGNTAGPDLVVINSSSGTLVGSTILVGANATSLGVDPVTGLVYSWSSVGRNLTRVNLTTDATSVASPTLGPEPYSTAFSVATNRVFMTDVFTRSIVVLNATSGLTAAPPITLSWEALSVAADPSMSDLYVGALGEVVTLNPKTDQVVAQNSSLTGQNDALTVDSTDGLLWVANEAKGLVALNLTTLHTAFTVGIPTGFVSQNSVTLDPTVHELFVVNTTTHDVEVVNSINGDLLDAAIVAGPNVTSVVYDPADNAVYALGANVTIIDPSTYQVMGSTISIAPHAVATGITYDPTREAIYATTATRFPIHTGTVSVLDGSSVTASRGSFASISAGQLPTAPIAIELAGGSSPAYGDVWVPNLQSGTISVIASPPVITYLMASPAAVDLNQTSQILLGYEGGTGPTEISYAGLPTGCASGDLATLNCTASETGTFTITATVRDALGVTANATTSLTIVAGLTLRASTSPGPNPVLDVGTLLSCQATALGGAPPYSYSWSFGDGSSAFASSATHRYTDPGAFIINVSSSDAHGAMVRHSVIATVEPLPSARIASAPSNATDVGVPLQLAASIAGGTAVGEAGWAFGDGATSTGLVTSHVWNHTGHYAVFFHYQDSSGAYANQTFEVQVNPALMATFSSGEGASSSPLSVGTLIAFTALVSGGTMPYTVVWSFGDGSSSQGLSVSHTYAVLGSYSVNVTLTDAAHGTVNATLPLTVAANPSSSAGGPNDTFDLGIFFGVVAGGGIAAVALYVAGSSRRRRPPAHPYIPPPSAVPPTWKED